MEAINQSFFIKAHQQTLVFKIILPMIYENSALQWLYSNAWCIVASIYHAACTLHMQVALSILSENTTV